MMKLKKTEIEKINRLSAELTENLLDVTYAFLKLNSMEIIGNISGHTLFDAASLYLFTVIKETNRFIEDTKERKRFCLEIKAYLNNMIDKFISDEE